MEPTNTDGASPTTAVETARFLSEWIDGSVDTDHLPAIGAYLREVHEAAELLLGQDVDVGDVPVAYDPSWLEGNA